MKEVSVYGYTVIEHLFDVVVVGGGGAGLMVASETAKSGLSVACVSKMFPTRSNTVMAQGGIAASLGNVDEDSWLWHFYDTVKSGDGLGDKDSIELLCKNAPLAVIELEHFGVPFSRTPAGKIDQRKFGGMTKNFGTSDLSHRTCYASDKTGHAILHTLYQQCMKHDVEFFSEFVVLDLLISGGIVIGVLSWSMCDGSFHSFLSSNVVIATGGYARVFEACTTSYACTGDGGGMIFRAGLALQDIEFVQFHPTGLYPSYRLITEAVRSEGAYLVNSKGDRFMKTYSTQFEDLATRDIVSRSIMKEIMDGNGCGLDGNHVLLNGCNIPNKIWNDKLPSVYGTIKTFASVDPTKEPIPVIPTAHYSIGGIPTLNDCRVIGADGSVVPGLLSVGEAACVSVHGANRLGSNSLLELIVFGKIAAETVIKSKKSAINCDSGLYKVILGRFDSVRNSTGFTSVNNIRKVIHHAVGSSCGVIKSVASLLKARSVLETANEMLQDVTIGDRGLVWNAEIFDCLELYNLILHAVAMVDSSLARKESRGSHYIKDFPESSDDYRYHSIVSIDNSTLESNLSKRPVSDECVSDAAMVSF